jgi:transposase
VHDGARVDDGEQSKAADRRIAELEARLVAATKEIARLRERYQAALEKLALAERRILLGKAERRVDDSDAQLTLEGAFAELKALEKELAAATDGITPPIAPMPPVPKVDGRTKPKTPPKGRRDLSKSALPVRVFDVLDTALEASAERVGFEEVQRLGYQRGGFVRLVMRLATYKVKGSPRVEQPDEARMPERSDPCPPPRPRVIFARCERAGARPDVTGCERAGHARAKKTGAASAAFRLVSTAMPKEVVRRGLLAPTAIAHVLVQKYCMGVPFHRLEQKLSFDAFPLDRGTMCRYAEHVGATLGAIVEAMRKHALATAFCLSTDATGASIQPQPLADGGKQPCRKGHFFVTLADRDHVFFDYQAKHNSVAVWTMFKGYTGYIQADAHAIYNALFRGTAPEGAEETEGETNERGPPPKECACWSHSRRKFWEAAVCRHRVGVEGLRRINDIFLADAKLAELSPAQRKIKRDADVRPLVDEFFAWAKAEKLKLTGRGLAATAIGYALNHEEAFRRFLEDGRLLLENNRAERALRSIATARKSWLFFGSDDHASSAANLFSLVASCKLHRLDVEAYLTDVIRLIPYWPKDRLLELAPKFWADTRARLDPEEMKLPIGPVTMPPPKAAEEQSASG